MEKHFVFILFLLAHLLNHGFCVQNITCRHQNWHKNLNTCYIAQFPVSDPFSFQVNYTHPSDIEVVEFGMTFVKYIPRDIFTSFPKMETLLMFQTGVSQLTPGDFEHANCLKEMRLSYNNIKVIRNGIFSPTLEKLFNDVHNHSEPMPLQSLGTLFLNANQISEIEPNSFKGLRSLEWISLENNELSVIKEGLFAGLTKLQTLWLGENIIATIEQGAFDDMPRLISLDLHSNRLTQLPDGIFDQLPALEELIFDQNELNRLSDKVFDRLFKLKRISLKYNNLMHLGQSMYHLPKVREISLNNNQIDDFNLIAFAHIPELKTLDLTQSGLTFANVDINEDEQWNSTLDMLIISKNNLTNAMDLNKLRIFPKLRILTIAENPFKNLEVGVNRTLKDVLPALTHLDLLNNGQSCEYLLMIKERYRAVNVFIGSFPHSKSDCIADWVY